MLINPVTVRTHRRVIERAIEALKLQKEGYERRLAGKRVSRSLQDDLTFEVAAIERAIDDLVDQIGEEG